ncbi:MAG: VCBS repeat-containing protein [Planctomycetes bacterium]|nr:VCBS repeat-containing protein [Planctomycetota bacterium]
MSVSVPRAGSDRCARFAAIGVLALCSSPALAQETPRYVRSELELPHPLQERLVWDANADRKVDLVLYRGGQLALHLQDAEGRFASEPTRSFALPQGTTLFGFGDLDDDGRLDLLAHTHEGLRALTVLDGSAPKIALPDASRSLFRSAGELAPHIYWHFLHDLAAGAPAELVLPERGGFAIHELTGERRAGFLRCTPRSIARLDPPGLEGRLRLRTRVPPVAFFPRRGASELLSFSRGRLVEHYAWRARDGALHPERVASLELLAPASGADAFFEASDPRPEVLERASLCELDGDGWPDLVRYDEAQRSFAFVYGRAGAHRVEAPDDVLRIAAHPARWRLADLDGDARAELLLFEEQDVKAPVGALRAWLGGGSKAQLSVFVPRRDARGFEPYPSFRGSYALRTELGSLHGNLELALRYVVNLDGDFDGDGRVDLVTQPADLRLEVRRGLAGARFEEAPWLALELPSDASYRDVICQTSDLDHDGRADLLLHYRGWDGSPAEKLVVWVAR